MHTSSEIRPDAERWIRDFEEALGCASATGIRQLFAPESWWRDLAALTWNYRQAHGRDRLEELLLASSLDMMPTDFAVAPDWPEPTLVSRSPDVFEFFFSFRTRIGSGTGLVHAHLDPSRPSGLRAWRLYTQIDSLHDVLTAIPHPRGRGFAPRDETENWSAARERAHQFLDRDPEVLVVGGGHAGIMLAAHLAQLGVDALIVERNARAGDNWRTRYHNLTLHTPIEMTRFPYMTYPVNFPEYMSKDKLASWLESYVENLDLAYWTSSEFMGASFDELSGTWAADVRRADGTTRTMRPKHVVMATGGNGGFPYVPELPGIDGFGGAVLHSSAFTGAEHFRGKRALVLGVGTSAHDIAHDLYRNGAKVTMVQRSPVAVLSLESANEAYGDYFRGVPDVLVDMRINAGKVFPLLRRALLEYQQNVVEVRDRDLLDRLKAAGMRLEDPEDPEKVWFYKYFTNGGGYYLNVGTSELIADRKIDLIQSASIAAYHAEGAVLVDGTVLAADVIVAATGFQGRDSEVAKLFGKDLADRVGPVGRGFDAEGEWINVWKRTAQRGLWFLLGGIETERQNTWQVALMIKADLLGIVPASVYAELESSSKE